MLTREQQKENAIYNLKMIGCYKPYLKAFEDGTVTMYEGFGGYYIDEVNEPDLVQKIKEVEEKYNGVVYAVIHSLTGFGELYTMLWSTGYEEDAEYNIPDDFGDGTYGVMSYVWNKTDDWCSEFGTVQIKPSLGGLLRVG